MFYVVEKHGLKWKFFLHVPILIEVIFLHNS